MHSNAYRGQTAPPCPALRRRASRARWALLTLLWTIAPACSKPPPQKTEDKAPRVEVVAATQRTFRGVVPITGELRPIQEVTLKSRVGGNVVELNFDEGDAVKKGQLIARIEDLTPQAQLRSTHAAVLTAEAQLARAQAELERVQRDRHRLELLSSRGAADQKSVDDSRTGARLAEVAVQAAQAQLQQARAAQDAAGVAVAETQYRAPFDGVISRRGVSKHEYIDTFKNRDIVTIVDNSAMELVASVAADLAVGINRGVRVDFHLAGLPGQTLSGEVISVNPAVDPRTRTVRLRVRLPNPTGALKGGLYATGQVVIGGERTSVAVPAAAAHHEISGDGQPDRDVVWRVKGGAADRIEARVGVQEGDFLEVLQGLAPGDLVVVSSPAALRPGLPVTAQKVQWTGEAPAAPAAAPAAPAAPAAAAPAAK